MSWATRLLGRNCRQDAHLQHAVHDHAREADRAREIVVEVDGVLVPGRRSVSSDLLARELDLALCHERITKSVRERHTSAPAASVVSVSNVTKRMLRRLVSEATRPTDVTVSPARGWRCHSNSCSACSKRAKSIAASSSPNSCGAVAPKA